MAKKIVKQIKYLSLFIFLTLTSPSPIHGQGVHGNCGGTKINTAIGCIPYGNTQALTQFFLIRGMGLAGGLFILLASYAGFLIMTSSGDPRKTQAGKELLTAAIGGLIFLIFSIFILRVVGMEILQIPGFE